MQKVIVTGGKNRLTHTLVCSEMDFQSNMERLLLKQASTPDMKVAAFNVSDVPLAVFREIKQYPELYTLEGDQLVKRPGATITLDNDTPVVGDVVNVTINYSDGKPPSPMVLRTNGVPISFTSNPLPLRADQEGIIDMMPVSEKHLCHEKVIDVVAQPQGA